MFEILNLIISRNTLLARDESHAPTFILDLNGRFSRWLVLGRDLSHTPEPAGAMSPDEAA